MEQKKPEILAPAGTLEAVTTVLDAGADAVYLGGKSLNMRQHRSSYNLDEDQLAEAIQTAHGKGKKLYFTLNSLVSESELPQARKTLALLGRLKPDAIIVQDLGIAALARETCVHLPLHASTMMNVHNVETALSLKMMGFTRIITSRDIPLHEVRRLGEQSGLEMEYFVHGDMCVAQSSQCFVSGILFGESSNCGRCMKPCRWQWELVAKKGSVEQSGATEGYLLARKDLCLYQHIPALIQNGIASLKIEGRMRTAEFLAPVVEAYRQAVDRYCEDPVGYATNAAEMDRLFEGRVRELTTAMTFGNSGAMGVDPSGQREPRFFSYSSPDPMLTVGRDIEPALPSHPVELIVHVANARSAEAALRAGADAIYLSGWGLLRHTLELDWDWIERFVATAAENNARTALLMPHICEEQDIAEWRPVMARLRSIGNVGVGVGNLGCLKMARESRIRDILTDFSLNVANSVSTDELSTMGATRVTASIELDYNRLVEMLEAGHMPIELIGQGPLLAMTLRHCIIAAADNTSPDDVCSMHCRKGIFALRDCDGHEFHLEADRRCGNYLFTPADICVLPNLSRVLSSGIAGLRIEAYLDSADTVTAITQVYRQAIDAICRKDTIDTESAVEKIRTATGRPMSDGSFDFENIATTKKESKSVV